MKFLLSILVIIGNLNVLLANNDNCRENDLNALMVRLRVLRTDFDKQKKVLEDQKAEIEDLRQKTSSEIAEIKESMKNVSEVVEESTSSLDGLKNVTDDIKEQIKELNKTMENKTKVIAFNVEDAVNYTGTDAIIFAKIILNEGKAYNKDTGNFTAPINGIYQFNAHICGNKIAEEIDYHIKVNSKWIVTGGFTVPDKASDAKCTSFSAVALVLKGENVRVGGMSFSALEETDNDLCSFSGVLIKSK